MFAKVFSQIFDSSIAQDYTVRHLFMDMLALSDKTGAVDMTHEAIARRTNVPLRVVKRCITALEQPDEASRSKECAGRRIVPLDSGRTWGWQIVNFEHYRTLRDEEARKAYFRDYQRDRRAEGRSVRHSVKDRSLTNGDNAKNVASASSSVSESKGDSKGKSRCTQVEAEEFCQSIGLPRSDGEAMFLHWQEKGWGKVKDWQLTIRKWKSFGYLPSQKANRNGHKPGPTVPARSTKPQPEGWEAWRKANYPESRESDFWRAPGDVQAEFRKGAA